MAKGKQGQGRSAVDSQGENLRVVPLFFFALLLSLSPSFFSTPPPGWPAGRRRPGSRPRSRVFPQTQTTAQRRVALRIMAKERKSAQQRAAAGAPSPGRLFRSAAVTARCVGRLAASSQAQALQSSVEKDAARPTTGAFSLPFRPAFFVGALSPPFAAFLLVAPCARVCVSVCVRVCVTWRAAEQVRRAAAETERKRERECRGNGKPFSSFELVSLSRARVVLLNGHSGYSPFRPPQARTEREERERKREAQRSDTGGSKKA